MNKRLEEIVQIIFDLKEENKELKSTLVVLNKYNLSNLIEDEILNRMELNKIKIQTIIDYDITVPKINIKLTNDGFFQIRTKFTRIRLTESGSNREIFENLQKINSNFMLEFLINIHDRCKMHKILVSSSCIRGTIEPIDKLTDLICKIKLDSDLTENTTEETLKKLDTFSE